MTPEQIALVEQTLAVIEPVFDGVVADFYRRLFRADPAVAKMFTADPGAQRLKLAAELDLVMRSIRHHEEFLARAATLGRQHQAYGVRPRDYATARVALMGALAEAMGERWTEPVAAAWTAAYNLTTEAMLAAGSPAAAVSVSQRRR